MGFKLRTIVLKYLKRDVIFTLQLIPLPMIPLVEGGEEHYHISVYTSWESKGRFTGTVSLQLYGVDGESLPFELTDRKRKVCTFDTLVHQLKSYVSHFLGEI